MLQICLFLLGFLTLKVAAQSTSKFCANIIPSQASGASGNVAIEIGQGVAYYSFSLDLSKFSTTLCPDLSKGIKYHVHTSWGNTTAMSTANSLCSTASGHYDPNFACSNTSSAIKTQCASIGRTWSNGYRYACNPQNYQAGYYDLCEVGDTSAKNGILYPDSNNQVNLAVFADYQPPVAYNYGSADFSGNYGFQEWLSYVFHCAENNNRLVCAKFSNTDLSACTSSFNSIDSYVSSLSSSDDDSVSKSSFNAAVALSTILCTIGGLAIGLMIGWLAFRSLSEDTQSLSKVQTA